ncbi:hypothetical protein pipiens_011531 [Culex pipiens pipiens]|uniref:G-protein coupled receptors family 1 profile domain-containing protein n=1 Tax=Culex pipiens pipiens TaxID=38569 RepID=A0ABD1D5Y1_CULPP
MRGGARLDKLLYRDPVEMWLWSATKPVNYFRYANQASSDSRYSAAATIGYGLIRDRRLHTNTTLLDAASGEDGSADDGGPGGTTALNNYWALLATVLVFGTAAGNILVCLAIVWERRLQNVTNYFLMSLAITDLMVALSTAKMLLHVLHDLCWFSELLIFVLHLADCGFRSPPEIFFQLKDRDVLPAQETFVSRSARVRKLFLCL